MSESLRTTVIGAGAWGTALAMVLAEKDHDVQIWSYEDHVAASINRDQENPYLEGVELPASLRAVTDLVTAVERAQLVVSVSPSQVVRQVMQVAGPAIPPDALLVSASKGIELGSLECMDQVIAASVGTDATRRLATE